MILKQINGHLRINFKARDWCKLPYPNHPRGCPNYGNRYSCPPEATLITEFIDIYKPMYLIAVEFDLANHISRMKHLHPNWSDRQARCVLYWQNKINKELRDECDNFKWLNPDMITTNCPEAMGVNVIATAKRCGLMIELKPKNRVYKIAIAGYPIKEFKECKVK